MFAAHAFNGSCVSSFHLFVKLSFLLRFICYLVSSFASRLPFRSSSFLFMFRVLLRILLNSLFLFF